MNQLIDYLRAIEQIVKLEPEVRILKPELALPNHVIILLKNKSKKIKEEIENVG